MAEYYPLLAKAVGSLPNSTLETRRVVYERARKALIGQLRTLHPPIADEDIERESLELDRAVQRLESELAQTESLPRQQATEPAPVAPVANAFSKPNGEAPAPSRPNELARPDPVFPGEQTDPGRQAGDSERAGAASANQPRTDREDAGRAPSPALPLKPAASGIGTAQGQKLPIRPAQPKSLGLGAAKRGPSASPILKPPMVRAKLPLAPVPAKSLPVEPPAAPALPPRGLPDAATLETQMPASQTLALLPDDGPEALPETVNAIEEKRNAPAKPPLVVEDGARLRGEGQRPIAPAPPADVGARRRVWILPVGIGLIVAAVGVAAYTLRDTRQSLIRPKIVEAPPTKDTGKIAERVGDKHDAGDKASSSRVASAPSAEPSSAAPSTTAPATAAAPATTPSASMNPELPVAHRAALLMEAPEETNKVKTFIGNVVWRLNNVSEGPGAGVGLAVEADIDIPDDKLKAVITFEKNTDTSLPASHTVKVRFNPQPGSSSGDVQQISVPQMRQEDNPTGEAFTGVTVPVMQNTFLVGLSPGTAEVGNIRALKDRQWIDVPILLSSGKVAKLTFEKGQSGTRDINEAISAWQKS